MTNKLIKHNQPYITSDDIKAVENVLKSNWIAQGPQVEQIEEHFREMFRGGKACTVSNGSSALYLALKALGADKNAHVILPTYACSALLNAIHLIGAKPILVDVDEDTFCLDGNLVKRFSKKAKYVIAVHTFGSIVDIEPLRSDTNYIVEDCCHPGSRSITKLPW